MMLTACMTIAQGAPAFQIVDEIAIGGAARWDYLTIDPIGHRLYLSHGTQTEVIDTRSDKHVATIAPTPGAHGIAISQALRRGFISNGAGDSVSVFNLDSLKIESTIKVGRNPDAIVYEPHSGRVVTFNGKSQDASVIDAQTLLILGTVPIGGKPEFAQASDSGTIYFNVEDTHELAVLDPVAMKLLARYSLSPCEGPSGLAVDDRRRVYSVCENRMLVVSAFDGKRIAQVPIGSGSDGLVWLDGYVYTANGIDGTISVVNSNIEPLMTSESTFSTALGARTIAADPATRKLYLPTATPAPTGADGRKSWVEDTLRVLVLQRR